ncbi:hypothetical protein PICSAR15_04432 [Mycobacterium avium subsp. paratuberculosis]|nr:hypothetical protein B0173_00774 [Mycobacterium avium subsp. paratuberculosis]CAG6935486.1 hypothetical protein PICSAR124B_04498 [Mycobacterium avium subsp. paratuberculosis]CAG6935863.1 hypothetical protein PICSAR113_04466 [Mycobacterium avium subsp. paratuberculosis]CAG6936382.1 hypothetical protein PICSAR120_04450 [Mycobacterium avium subsp. paratuberculosis]CAG6936951.1 hypothetical protein PICSAR107_04457 [Mycobacterium avium subsp. paratuberculosis]
MPVGPEDVAFHPGHPRLVGPHIQIPAGHRVACPAHRIGIHGRHYPIHRGGQPTAGQRRPPRHQHGQRGVHPGQHLRISDQIGAKHQGLKRPVIDAPGREHRPDLRQPFPHRHRITQIAVPHRHAAAQRRPHLRGHRLPGIGGPIRPLPRLPATQHQQLGDRHQPGRGRPRLGPGRLPRPIQQRHRLRRGPRRHHILEHVFDHSIVHRRMLFGSSRRVDNCGS